MNRIAIWMRSAAANLSKITIILAVAGIANGSYGSGVVDRAERLAFDLRMKIRGSQTIDPRIVVIEIDRKTTDQIGSPPLSEDKYAEVVRALAKFGAKTIVMNGVFPGKEPGGGEFASALRETGIAFVAVDLMAEGGLRASAADIRRASKGEGHRVLETDPDGVLRRVAFRIESDGGEYIALGIRAGLDAHLADIKKLQLYSNYAEVPMSGNSKLQIPLEGGRHILNWPGRWSESFTRISFVDVLVSEALVREGQEPRFDTDVLSNSICVIGVTVTGFNQNFITPIESGYPSMGVQAVMLNSILERRFLAVSSDTTNIAIAWGLSAMIFVIVLISNFIKSLQHILMLGVLYSALSLGLFVFAGLALPLAHPLMVIVSGLAVLAFYHQVVSYLERLHLLRMVTKDPMTSLFNYGHFQILLMNEVELVDLKRERKLSILMLDIDYFKRVNDTCGHAAGDEVIRRLAEILKLNCRSLDAACRYGGEEFLLMLPGATLEDAGRIAERIRRSFFETKFMLGELKTPVQISVSIGVASYFYRESLDAFLRRADRALYKAKEAGRNMICRA